jgi:hypothetical protein
LYFAGRGSGILIMEEAVFRGNTESGLRFADTDNPYTILITKGIWEDNEAGLACMASNTGLSLIIKDGVFKNNGGTSSSDRSIEWRSPMSLINVSITGNRGIYAYNLSQMVLINVSSTGTSYGLDYGSVSSRGTQFIYNSRISSGPSGSSIIRIANTFSDSVSLGPFKARKSIIEGAAAGASYTESYWSTEVNPASSNGYGLAKEIFSRFSIQTNRYDGSHKINLDMSDFVESEHDQGDDQYYPASAQAFDDTYYGGALSDAVVNALQKDWDKDLAGNPRSKGASIDVGPYEIQE